MLGFGLITTFLGCTIVILTADKIYKHNWPKWVFFILISPLILSGISIIFWIPVQELLSTK
jgi:hypothetical protein